MHIMHIFFNFYLVYGMLSNTLINILNQYFAYKTETLNVKNVTFKENNINKKLFINCVNRVSKNYGN